MAGGRLLGIHGFAGSGKDTAADVLAADGWLRRALADAMKHICQDLFDWDPERLWGPSAKRNEVDPKWGFSARDALVPLGTEWGRTLNEDLWIRVLCARLPKETDVVITDVRFQNEVDFIAARGGATIEILRPGVGPGAHASEAGGLVRLDGSVRNDGSIDDLHRRVREECANIFG